jgi:endonuclease/exonuclease/phosphatase family metal-dependent hydrolase
MERRIFMKMSGSKIWRVFLVSVCLALFLTGVGYSSPLAALAEPLSVISYNVESDDLQDTDPVLVGQDIETIGVADLWGLSEVSGSAASEIFRRAIATPDSDYRSILGTTGTVDRLQIVYDAKKLKLIADRELRGSGGTRDPLVAQFEFLPTGREFLFTVNHFNRRDEEKREAQAEFLRDWAEQQTLPIIAVGDYNFDYEPQTQQGNEAFDIFQKNDTFEWIQPQCLDDRSCPATGTQCNPNYSSILDFVFVSGGAKNWQGQSDVLFLDEDICAREGDGFSDHRPVAARFEIP